MRFKVDEAIEMLARTPDRLQALCADLSSTWTDADEGPDTFSTWENLAHLLQGERADWIPRARIILAQGESRRFTPFDRRAHRTACAGRSIAQLLDEFRERRASNLRELRGWSLSGSQLALTGEHPELGTVTLQQLLATWVVHDLGHIGQIARVQAKRYRADVGPWRAYLPVLDRGPR
ncbi:MAG: DinB family protein [Gemmatimonadaceae bacterium]|nr:DinB family protein [Gemmatimonadaceae bacterium]